MSMFALRIPQGLKKEMQKFQINWSDYLRYSIREAVDSERKRHFFQKLQELNSNQKFSKKGTAENVIRKIRSHG